MIEPPNKKLDRLVLEKINKNMKKRRFLTRKLVKSATMQILKNRKIRNKRPDLILN